MSTTDSDRGRRRVQRGRVVSDKMDKTISVNIEWRAKHALYGKYIRRRTRLYAHDAENTAHVGDLVEVQETRPLSKQKRWRLVKVLERSRLAQAGPSDPGAVS